MKLQVRTGLFETNSSSTHSLTMCMKEDWEAFKNGDKYYDRWEDKLVDPDEFSPEDLDPDETLEDRYLTFDDFETEIWDQYEESICEEFTTPFGETIVAFGYAGHDW